MDELDHHAQVLDQLGVGAFLGLDVVAALDGRARELRDVADRLAHLLGGAVEIELAGAGQPVAEAVAPGGERARALLQRDALVTLDAVDAWLDALPTPATTEEDA